MTVYSLKISEGEILEEAMASDETKIWLECG